MARFVNLPTVMLSQLERHYSMYDLVVCLLLAQEFTISIGRVLHAGYSPFWLVLALDLIVKDLLKADGCYLYCNMIELEWRRSGKVSDCSFGTRHKDHWKNTKNSGPSTSATQSKLYTEYPSKESNLVRLGMAFGEKCRKGYF